ncbi:hypothetical protein BKA69DRAFT_76469 [Paraphysoderma sedebokerense]|nr:hypothetical protein BKA69DRAFT_76469 [Paraphysoderma sedebokerense]
MSGKPISDPATSVLYIQHAITQLMDYVQREYRAWLDSEEFGNNSPRFLEIECNNVKIREKCQKLLDDFIDRMRDLHPYNVNTESEENADRLSEILKELRNYFREKLKIRNSLIQAERKDEEIKITTHPLPTPKRFNGRYVIPEGDNYAKLEDCKKFVQIFKHNTFATLQRRERKVIPVIPEIPNKWFNELPADVKGSTIILTCNKNYRHKKCIGITFADTSLNDNKLRPFREVPKNGQNILKNIPPVFIPTYPRQAQGESSSQIEEIIPHIEYLENLRSLNTSIKEQEIEQITFLVFEDDKEHNRLKNYHRKYGNIPNVYFLVLEHDIFNLNTVCNMGIGRKRTFIQVAAEYFKFPFFAVIDDDIGRYEEFSPKHHQNIFDEYTTFRSLAFLRKSLLTEMFPLNNEELKRFKLLLSSEVLKFALSSGLSEEEMECKSEQISAKIVSYVEGMQADAETRPVIAWEMLKYLSIDPEIASLASSKEKTLLSALKKKFNLFKSCDHIGTAALVNRASTAYATLYRRLQNFQKTTHYISSMIYQCVMYHTDAIKGLYHVDQDVFFNEECLSHQDRAQLMKQTKGPDDANGQALMKLGYKHEDKYHHRQLLLHGVTGFQVYWYNIENNKEESLVNGNANSYSLVHGQAIEATTNGHSNAKSQTTVPGQSTARSETSGLGENADSRKRKRRESNDEAQ